MLKRNLHLFCEVLKHANALKLCHNSLWNISTQMCKIFRYHPMWIRMFWLIANAKSQECDTLNWHTCIVWCEITNGRQRWFALTAVVISTKYSTEAQKACVLKSRVLLSQGGGGSDAAKEAPDLSLFNCCQEQASSRGWKWYLVESRGGTLQPSLICTASHMS